MTNYGSLNPPTDSDLHRNDALIAGVRWSAGVFHWPALRLSEAVTKGELF